MAEPLHISEIEPHHFMPYPGNADRCYGCGLERAAPEHTYNPKINRHPPARHLTSCGTCGAEHIDPIHWPLTHLEFRKSEDKS